VEETLTCILVPAERDKSVSSVALAGSGAALDLNDLYLAVRVFVFDSVFGPTSSTTF